MQTNTGSESGSASSVGGAVSGGTAPAKTPKGFRLSLQQMLAGLQAVIPDGSSLPTTGGSLTKADMVKRLSDGMSEYLAIDAEVTALGKARLQLRDDLPALQAYYVEVKESLLLYFGKRSPQLAQFGLAPQKLRKPLTSEQKVARAEKARATRQLRHTGGVRQKAAVQYEGAVDVASALRPTPGPNTSAAPSVEASPGVGTPGKPAATPPASTG
jgi:hypothetical protein